MSKPENSTSPRIHRGGWLENLAVPSIILIVSGLAFYALGARPDQQRKPTRPQQSLLVDTASVQSVDGELIIETTGEVVPHREVAVSTEVAGRISRINPKLRVGEFVTEGELLLEIDTTWKSRSSRPFAIRRKAISARSIVTRRILQD